MAGPWLGRENWPTTSVPLLSVVISACEVFSGGFGARRSLTIWLIVSSTNGMFVSTTTTGEAPSSIAAKRCSSLAVGRLALKYVSSRFSACALSAASSRSSTSSTIVGRLCLTRLRG